MAELLEPRFSRVVVILRHNTQMSGDYQLAERELCSLAKCEGEWLATADELGAVVNMDRLARHLILPSTVPDHGGVAYVFDDLSLSLVKAIIRRSAFGQELILLDTRASLVEAAAGLGSCCVLVNELEGTAIVALTLNYVVECEGVFHSTASENRLAAVECLLLAAFEAGRPSGESKRLRRAKKTTLSLTHDLHIYKAKFFPRMVRALLNEHASPGDVVVDPFCGSGTALLEGALLGFKMHGVDVDPICIRISQSKVAPFLEPDTTSRQLDGLMKALSKETNDEIADNFPVELHGKLLRKDKKNGTQFLPEILRESAKVGQALASIPRLRSPLLETLVSDSVTKKVRYRFVGVGNGRYTIEVLKKSLVARLSEKISRAGELADVFESIRDRYDVGVVTPSVTAGDARDATTWGVKQADIILTSPPYLPASSGREHYAASRALAFHVLGNALEGDGYIDSELELRATDEKQLERLLRQCPEAKALMDYLYSDATDNPDPQRDAMRFERKARPTGRYLVDMQRFFAAAAEVLSPRQGKLLLVVAHHHTFYSHRRNELEHRVSGKNLYAEIAALAGFHLEEELATELHKSAVSKARPRSKEKYFESILVFETRQVTKGKKRRNRAAKQVRPAPL